jgi:hypothetical protein
VSCLHTGTCFATGDFQAGGQLGQAQIERWNGKRWTAQPILAPPGSQGIIMGAIWCTATGWYCNNSALMTGLAERYS